MCLAALALNADARFPLVIAANRDEFFSRAAAPMAWRADILAGRDLSAGGTWFGLTRTGRLALLTNVREPGRNDPAAPTRGSLVVDWLRSSDEACAFGRQLPAGYNGFNLITGDVARGEWHWISNRAPATVRLPSGIHGISNAALNTPWPKTVGLQGDVERALAIADGAHHLAELLFAALADPRPAPDATLPDTGIGLARERQLSSRFIRIVDDGASGLADYGTRCSTVLVREASGRTVVAERTATADGRWLTPVLHAMDNWP